MIKVEIGKHYASVRDRLREEIRTGKLEGLELLAQNHACYCCVRRIKGMMYEVSTRTESGIGTYYFDVECYLNARAVEYKEGRMVQ